jgi:hypothetical protein
MAEAVDIHFAPQAVEADGLVERGSNVYSRPRGWANLVAPADKGRCLETEPDLEDRVSRQVLVGRVKVR